CQVLGRYPADKYRVSAEEVVQALAERTMARVVAARSLIQQLAFAYLTCNGDAHAKNFSIVQNRQWRPALAYDIPTTHPYGDTTMALQIQGRDREDIGRKDFLALGEACGVRAKAVERVLDELVGKMPTWHDRLEELPFDARTVHKLRKACSYRADRLRGL
ncbi:MAG TPA: HipA domain-containing protein, partial [Planctomycetota bacterium]|nr:HipA domain-containing protein [Planctomycetota bacterium]